jgi:hypothetical protein
VTALHVAAEIFAGIIIFIGAGLAFLAVCAALGRGQTPTPPHVPADVDLPQCLDTTRRIDEGGGR